MARMRNIKPPSMRTTFLVDAMYLHAAYERYDRALKEEARIPRASRKIERLKEREEQILFRHGGDTLKAYNELEPIYIEMESADYLLCQAYGPSLQSFALVQILCAASLEAHIVARGRAGLTGRLLEAFDRFSLEAKWLTLPKLLGLPGFDPGSEPFQSFAVLVRLRNSLVHYRERFEEWAAPGVPSFLGNLGLSKEAASRSIDCAVRMVVGLAKQLGEPKPFWLRHKGGISYFSIADE